MPPRSIRWPGRRSRTVWALSSRRTSCPSTSFRARQTASFPGSRFPSMAFRQRSAKGPIVTSKAPSVMPVYRLACRSTSKVSLSTGTGAWPAIRLIREIRLPAWKQDQAWLRLCRYALASLAAWGPSASKRVMVCTVPMAGKVFSKIIGLRSRPFRFYGCRIPRQA